MNKTLIFIELLALFFCSTMASSADVMNDKVFLKVVQPQGKGIPNEATSFLETKMNQIVAANGVAELDDNNRFVLTAKADVLSKDITSGPPQRVSMNVEFTFLIGDVVENKIYETMTISVPAVGVNENKAFIMAVKNIKQKNEAFVTFLLNAKQKIVDYYSLRCNQIEQEAERKSAARDYDGAIYLLMQIPDVCDCSEECQNRMIQYNVEKNNYEAEVLFNEAKSRWSESPNAAGASVVADILCKIPVGTPVQPELNKLQSEINQKLRSDEKKEWEFKMQKYKDDVEKQKRDDDARLEQMKADNEYRAKQQKADNERMLRQQEFDNQYKAKQQEQDNEARRKTIEACRQVGLEYAKNQPKVKYDVVYLW